MSAGNGPRDGNNNNDDEAPVLTVGMCQVPCISEVTGAHSNPGREATLPLVLHFLPVHVPRLRADTHDSRQPQTPATPQRRLLSWHLWPLFAATSFTSWRHRLSLVPCSNDKGSTAAKTLPLSVFISQHRWAFLGVVFQGICTSFLFLGCFHRLSFIF